MKSYSGNELAKFNGWIKNIGTGAKELKETFIEIQNMRDEVAKWVAETEQIFNKMSLEIFKD